MELGTFPPAVGFVHCDVFRGATKTQTIGLIGSCHSRSTSAGSGSSPQRKSSAWTVEQSGNDGTRADGSCCSPGKPLPPMDLFDKTELASSGSRDSIGLPPGLEDLCWEGTKLRVGAEAVNRMRPVTVEQTVNLDYTSGLPCYFGEAVSSWQRSTMSRSVLDFLTPPAITPVTHEFSTHCVDIISAADCRFSVPPPPARTAPLFCSVDSPPPARTAPFVNLHHGNAARNLAAPAAVPPPPTEWAPVIDNIDVALPPPPPTLMPALATLEPSPRIGSNTLASDECQALASIGSAAHTAGTCRPCAFVHTRGCVTGTNCLFCHLCTSDDKRKLKRDQKKERREAKKLVQRC